MPRDGSATRRRILDAARELVIANGFRATTIDTVLAASGTSKGAFFHHFDSKSALADALVEAYVADDLDMLELGLEAAASAGTTGCLYTSVLVEMELIDAGTSDPIEKAVTQWREAYADLLRGALGDRHDVDALSDHLFVTFEGAFLLARTTGDPGEMRRQLGTLRLLVETLLRGGD